MQPDVPVPDEPLHEDVLCLANLLMEGLTLTEHILLQFVQQSENRANAAERRHAQMVSEAECRHAQIMAKFACTARTNLVIPTQDVADPDVADIAEALNVLGAANHGNRDPTI